MRACIITLIMGMINGAPSIAHAEEGQLGKDGGNVSETNVDDELDAIFQAWSVRQDRVKSARFQWAPDPTGINQWSTYQTTWATSSNSRNEAPVETLVLLGDQFKYQSVRWYYRTDREYAGFNATREDTEHYFPLDRRANLKTITSLFDTLGDGFAEPSDQFRTPRPFARTCDGSLTQELFERGDTHYSEGAIYENAASHCPDDLVYRPLLLAFRPFSLLTPSIDVSNCRLEKQSSYVNGHDCRLLRETVGHGISRLYWVDPRREHVVVRHIELHDDQPAAQIEIDYVEDPEQGWVPSHWTSMLMRGMASVEEYPGRGEVFQFVTMDVTSFAINEKIAAQELLLSFPPETIVNDSVREQTYVMKANGQHEALTREHLLSLQEHGIPQFSKLIIVRRWMFLAGIGMILTALVLKIHKRYSRDASVPAKLTE